ncbi:MAG TPA: hypothetical protein VJ799_07260 [Nitrososphaeraceae archaeon]|jgi:uncharacterized membrane protein|nr:hypothetical protein [Nitrososphaeraceae archaeon]HZB74172.1 hypothetical protein [Nitrososphaeraceae archaeon]
MDTQTLVIFALVAALGLVTGVAVNVMLTAQEAEQVKHLTKIKEDAYKDRIF